MSRGVEQPAQQVARRLTELAGEFAGWRIGRGGSGHWWAVRGNELLRSLDVEELRSRLHEADGPALVLEAGLPRREPPAPGTLQEPGRTHALPEVRRELPDLAHALPGAGPDLPGVRLEPVLTGPDGPGAPHAPCVPAKLVMKSEVTA